jgi:hypothetical protein
MADYFEIFDDTRAGIMGALDRAITEAHAWEFLANWNPEWEMVALPAIENRLPNFDAYDPDLYSDCFDMMWEIARTDWLTFREGYIAEHAPCGCRREKGKLADYCWPRYPEPREPPMCQDHRNYASLFDNYTADRLSRIDAKITERGDWEYWSNDLPESNEDFYNRVVVYEIPGITREEMTIMHDVARLGWFGFVRTRDLEMAAYLDEWRHRAYQDDPRHGEVI